MATLVQKTRGLRIATRCTTLEQFISIFQRFCDAKSVFISTLAMRPIGLETAFSIDLVGGTPALQGLGIVLDAWSSAQNPYGRPGLRLGVRRLTPASEKVLEQLLIARALTAEAAPEAEADVANTDVVTPKPLPKPPPIPLAKPARSGVVPSEARTPGGELVLPANPLTGITDESLEGFVDCTLYEETGTFFPEVAPLEDPLDPVAPPPDLVPNPRPSPIAIAPIAPPPPLTLPTTTPDVVEDVRDATIAPQVPYDHTVFPIPPLPPQPLRRSWTASLPKLVELARRRWYIGAAGAALLLIIVIAIAAGSSSARADQPVLATTTPHAPSPSPSPSPRISPTPTPTPTPAPTPAADPVDAGGIPTVGSGPCRLTVTSTPAGSTIAIDGGAAGPSPLVIKGPCQQRRVEISHARYSPVTRTIALTADHPQTIDVSLQRPTHTLMIDTLPQGATISIGGRRAGTTPTSVQLLGFTTVDLAITKPGFRPQTARIYSKVPNDHLRVALVRGR